MEITDLMLNDYVMIHCFDGSDIVIKVTRVEGESDTVYGISKQGSHWANIEDVKPIRITPKILEKNFKNEENIFGYKDYKLNYDFTLENRGERFSLVRKCSNFTFSTFWICDILYVHELQHALKMCWIKKEIEL